MRIYLVNNCEKFHPDPTWNDEALEAFLKNVPKQAQKQDVWGWVPEWSRNKLQGPSIR